MTPSVIDRDGEAVGASGGGDLGARCVAKLPSVSKLSVPSSGGVLTVKVSASPSKSAALRLPRMVPSGSLSGQGSAGWSGVGCSRRAGPGAPQPETFDERRHRQIGDGQPWGQCTQADPGQGVGDHGAQRDGAGRVVWRPRGHHPEGPDVPGAPGVPGAGPPGGPRAPVLPRLRRSTRSPTRRCRPVPIGRSHRRWMRSPGSRSGLAGRPGSVLALSAVACWRSSSRSLLVKPAVRR